MHPTGGPAIEDPRSARGARVPAGDADDDRDDESGPDPGRDPAQRPAQGPPGADREPARVALWTVLTLGLYQLYWLWVSSRSVERFDPRATSPFRVARWAIPLNVLGAVGLLVSGVLLIQATGVDPEAIRTGAVDLQELSVPGDLAALALASVGAALVGGIGVLVAYWRVWRFVEGSERRQGLDPIRPGWMLAIVLGAGLVAQVVPGVGFLLGPLAWAYVLYRSQEGLNHAWSRTTTDLGPGPGTGDPPDWPP